MLWQNSHVIDRNGEVLVNKICFFLKCNQMRSVLINHGKLVEFSCNHMDTINAAIVDKVDMEPEYSIDMFSSDRE